MLNFEKTKQINSTYRPILINVKPNNSDLINSFYITVNAFK